jgi:hypothetical protein
MHRMTFPITALLSGLTTPVFAEPPQAAPTHAVPLDLALDRARDQAIEDAMRANALQPLEHTGQWLRLDGVYSHPRVR